MWQTHGMHVADDVVADWASLKRNRPDESQPLDLGGTAGINRTGFFFSKLTERVAHGGGLSPEQRQRRDRMMGLARPW